MKCSNCNAEWTGTAPINFCPFCGNRLPAAKNDTLYSVLKTIRDQFGVETLANAKRVRSIFTDLAPQLKREQRLLDYLADCEGGSVLADASKRSPSERATAVNRLVNQMHNDLLVEESAAKQICQTYMDVLCNQESQKAPVSQPTKTATTIPSQPKATPAQAVSQGKATTGKKSKKRSALRFLVICAVLIGILTYFANTSVTPSSSAKKANNNGVISGTIVCSSSYQGDPDGEKPIGNYIYLYNSDGKCVYEKYEDHQVTLFDYDSSGNLIKESVYYDDQLFSVIEYDTFGNSTKELHYSGSGELTSSKEWINNYDDQNRLLDRSQCNDGFGDLILYEYNTDGSYRVWETDYYYGEDTYETCCSKYTYFDSKGNVIKKQTLTESTLPYYTEYTYTYDAFQNLIQFTAYTETSDETYDYENTYNDDGQLTEVLTYVSANPVPGVSDGCEHDLLYRVTYEYDDYDNCIREEKSFYNKQTDSFDAPFVSLWERDALGLLHSYTFEGELYASYEYTNLKNALYS